MVVVLQQKNIGQSSVTNNFHSLQQQHTKYLTLENSKLNDLLNFCILTHFYDIYSTTLKYFPVL